MHKSVGGAGVLKSKVRSAVVKMKRNTAERRDEILTALDVDSLI